MIDPELKISIDDEIAILRKQKLTRRTFSTFAQIVVYEAVNKSLTQIFQKMAGVDKKMKASLRAIRKKRLQRVEEQAIRNIRDQLKNSE
ncbi:hypothetical protein HYV71_01170 [Candidatus Uhrbacteria bacterium]|nr:hypothetical protein [Candidatus Uhrbacteria bacterium]